METNPKTSSKGRLSWLIPILEFIVLILYFAIGYGGICNAVKNMDLVGIFDSVQIAIWFLIVAIVVLTVLCFVPLFKSRGNKFWAVWNIIWIAFTIYSITS